MSTRVNIFSRRHRHHFMVVLSDLLVKATRDPTGLSHQCDFTCNLIRDQGAAVAGKKYGLTLARSYQTYFKPKKNPDAAWLWHMTRHDQHLARQAMLYACINSDRKLAEATRKWLRLEWEIYKSNQPRGN